MHFPLFLCLFLDVSFYLLFDVILRKVKIKILIISELYCSSLYCVLSDLNVNIRTFDSHEDSQKLISLYSIAYTCIYNFILSRILKTAQNWHNCFHLTPWCIHMLLIFSIFSLLISKEKLKGKKNMGCHNFTFPFMSSFLVYVVS